MNIELIRDDEPLAVGEAFVRLSCWRDGSGRGTLARIERISAASGCAGLRASRVILDRYPISEEHALWLAATVADHFGLRVLYARTH